MNKVLEYWPYAAALMPVLIWLWLLLFRQSYWRARQRMGRPQQDLVGTPSIAIIVPARDEEAHIGAVITALSQQDYPGETILLLVDDQSSDDTVQAAKKAALFDLHVVSTPPMPPGWTGKLWALETGVEYLRNRKTVPDYLWLTDADIQHSPQVLTALVTKSQARRSALTSLMVRLDTGGIWGRLLVPAFVYFFQLLYPFDAVNRPSSSAAGAAGGCILLDPNILMEIGGFGALKGALIDDCALAAKVKETGANVWLGHGTASRSLRSNRDLSTIWTMVRRTAYTQLGYNPLLLAACMVGLILTFLLPPLAVLAGFIARDLVLLGLGLLGWLLMVISARPTWQLYGRWTLEALLLPMIAGLYGLMTLHSGIAHLFGQGNIWKGRAYGRAHRNNG